MSESSLRVGVVTSSRADYGLLYWLIKELNDDSSIDLKLMITGSHLLKKHGYTRDKIISDGFKISDEIQIYDNNSEINVASAFSKCIDSFNETLQNSKIDILVLLGDRYEILSVAIAATLLNIPIAHIHGGESTFGSYDEAFRHSITKMSHLHFTSTSEYAKRVIQLGECPERVHNVGALGIESIRKLKLISKKELEEKICFSFNKKNILVTYHPTTIDAISPSVQINNILSALDCIDEVNIIFTSANADTDGEIINKAIKKYVTKNKNKSIFIPSLGQLKYLSVLKHFDCIVGNSSSGIIEAPSMKIPTLNIGDRQKGRVQSRSILNSRNNVKEISENLKVALSDDFKNLIKSVVNPYDGGNSSKKIIEIIKSNSYGVSILKKQFYDIKND
jgi:GDP/UDP-N,N'-diacetylbacillosamine 2-epimerase (hydrolysing)